MTEKELSENIKKFVGRRIQEFRLHKGLSQEKLAELIGKDSANAISYFESGSRKVSIDDLIIIAKALDANVEDFLPNSAKKAEESNNLVLKLRSDYKKLDKETEKSILGFAEMAKKKFGRK